MWVIFSTTKWQLFEMNKIFLICSLGNERHYNDIWNVIRHTLSFYWILILDQYLVEWKNFLYLNFIFEWLFILLIDRNLPRAALFGILLVTITYVLTNIAYFVILTEDEVLFSPAIAMVIE